MTEEIKEILEALKPHNDIKEYPLYLNRKQQDLLYDYITNLQQENEFLKLNNPEQNMEHFRIVKENKRKIDNLRKENEKLKEELKNRPIVDFTFDVYKELEDYKSRRKKAIEYINKQKKKMYKSRNKIALFILMKLENILNRSDEDEY